MAIIFTIFLFFVASFIYFMRNFDYWKKRGVKHDRPFPLVGTNAKVYFLQKSWSRHLSDTYKNYPEEKVVGSYRSSYPELIIRDPDIIKRILITDFNHFHLRRILPYEGSSEPLLRHLFNADGDLWRLLRQRLTPAFTSGKLRAMFPLIVERAERLHTRIQAAAGAPIDARDLMARFTTDFIGACGFGLDMDSLSDDESEFRKLSKKIFNLSIYDSIKFLLRQLPLKLFRYIRFTKRIERDLIALAVSVLKQRNYLPSGRNDFVDLLLQCKQKGTIYGESIERMKADGTPEISTLDVTDDLIAAQMFVFFAAGFETSSSTTSYTLHLLAYHPDIQKLVREDIRRALFRHDNKLCYDAISEMNYLSWAFKESMRLFPALGFLARECAHAYTIPELNLTIEPGVKIYISTEALHNDCKYFENPEVFIPERFSPAQLDTEKMKLVYLPFGDGPRACIGERLGFMQSMAGLAAVLSRYTVEPAPNSIRHPRVLTRPTLVQVIRGGLPLLFKEMRF